MHRYPVTTRYLVYALAIYFAVLALLNLFGVDLI